MIIQEFSFSNFKSFKELQIIDFASANIISDNKTLETDNLINCPDGKTQIIKSKCIYGGHAAGKTSAINALSVFNTVLKFSTKDNGVLAIVEPHELGEENNEIPVYFQLMFWHEGKRYRYGFETKKGGIDLEWLYIIENDGEKPYIIRDSKEVLNVNTDLLIDEKDLDLLFDSSKEGQALQNNQLLLAKIVDSNPKAFAKEIYQALTSILIVDQMKNMDMYVNAEEYLQDDTRKEQMLSLLQDLDPTLIGLRMFDIPEPPKDETEEQEEPKKDDKAEQEDKEPEQIAVGVKQRYNNQREATTEQVFTFIHQESEGSLKLFQILPLLIEALENQSPIVIGKLDTIFHPIVAKRFLELIHSRENIGTQLFATLRHTALLTTGLLRSDQIELVEKDNQGGSHLYSLAELKNIRENFETSGDWLKGIFGPIPFLGNFQAVLDTDTVLPPTPLEPIATEANNTKETTTKDGRKTTKKNTTNPKSSDKK